MCARAGIERLDLVRSHLRISECRVSKHRSLNARASQGEQSAQPRIDHSDERHITPALSRLAIQSGGSEPGAAAEGAGFSRTAAAVGVEGT